MESFKMYLEEAGAFLDTAFTGFDNPTFGIGHSLNLPTPTLDPPTKSIRSTICDIKYTHTPIKICLEDGTIWHCTKEQWEYLRSIGKQPYVGQTLQLELYLDGTVKAVSKA